MGMLLFFLRKSRTHFMTFEGKQRTFSFLFIRLRIIEFIFKYKKETTKNKTKIDR